MKKIYEITLEKEAARQVASDVIGRQITKITERALGAGRGSKQGWELAKIPRVSKRQTDDGWLYTCKLRFVKNARKVADKVVEQQFAYIQKIVEAASPSRGWGAKTESGKGGSTPEAPAKKLADVKVEQGKYFSHIYDRDAAINVVLSSLKAAKASNYHNRFHCLLWGPPGCGKSEILAACKQMIGPEGYLMFDATSTTQAGAERILLQSANIPPVMLVEEIEKTSEDSLRWLLGILDHRGEIRKTNYNVGSARRQVRMLCIATANDKKKFDQALAGALSSRFPHKIYCPRPDEALLRKILAREVEKAGGDKRWIDPAIEHCKDAENTDDPRRIIAVCLSGREKLLNGSFQKDLLKTTAPKEPMYRPPVGTPMYRPPVGT